MTAPLAGKYRVVVPSKPVPKGRPRFSMAGGKPRAFTPQATVTAESWVRLCCTQQVGTPCLRGPLRVWVEAVMPIPASMRRADRAAALAGTLMHTKKPDADNLAKLALDALIGIAWSDDTQVVELVVVKRYGAEPMTVIEWGPMPLLGLASGLL